MSDSFINAAVRLYQAVKHERDCYIMMGECPKDDIDLALNDFGKELNRLIYENTFKKDERRDG